jgi:hypothetical protein
MHVNMLMVLHYFHDQFSMPLEMLEALERSTRQPGFTPD